MRDRMRVVFGTTARSRAMARALLLVAAIAVLITSVSANPLGIPDSEYDALVALYTSTDGPNWWTSTNWLTENTPWYGVTVESGQIAEIKLNYNALSGQIPPQIGSLSNLESLGLGGNQLTGPIPAEIGSLSNLQYLDLSSNQLTGSMPVGSLSNLQYLDLSHNQLTGPIPAYVGALANLQELYLGGNQLTGPIPAWIGNLSSLSHLDLGWNPLTGPIPAEIGNLSNLESLHLDGAQLTGPIPPEIGNLSKLEYLELRYNQLTGPIPAEICCLSNLDWLDLSSNQLTGPIPAEIGNLSNLWCLALSSNQLTGPIPPEIGNLSYLYHLVLSSNQLTGAIPAEIGNLSNLGDLDLSNNQLTGPIPAWISNFSKLVSLCLGWNELTGAIPAWIRNLTNLEILDLSSNQFTGPIPPEIGDLSKLYYLGLSSRQLIGPIPAWIAKLTNLGGLDLSSNQLADPIPAWIGNLTNLEELDLSSNQFTGPIPPEIEDLSNLYVLDLSSNQFAGPIPPEIGNLLSLYYLNLSSNQLTGPIPAWIGDFSSLTYLGLWSNQLTGPIPSEIGNLLMLQYLLLHDNQFTGPMPPELGNLSNLEWLSLWGNQLSGEIPSSVVSLAKLDPMWTNISHNALQSSDPAVRAFLAVKSRRWESTQTVPPARVTATSSGVGTATAAWVPILYSGDPGYYEVGFGTSPTGPFTFSPENRTSDKTASSMAVTGLPTGGDVYVVVRTTTLAHASNQSDVTSLISLPALLAPPGAPKPVADDCPASVTGAVVTAVFGDDFYVEDPNRSWGIRVHKQGHGLAEGQLADVSGTMHTADTGERYIEADSALPSGSGAVAPIGMIGIRLGGGNWKYNPSTGAGQKGVANGSGLNNIGLLVKTWGKITQVGADYVYFDDGSGLRDGTFTDTDENIGIRVIHTPNCEVVGVGNVTAGLQLQVTGISSCFRTPSGQIARQILPIRVEGDDDVYDVDALGIPRFVDNDYIELAKIESISKFRSGVGHDYSDHFESCRSMKHYFKPRALVDWSTVKVFSPVSGTVSRITEEWAGTQIRVKSAAQPAFYFIVFHMSLSPLLQVGDVVSAGQQLGTHVGTQTMSDIAVGVNTPGGWKYLSYFDVMTDSLFAAYQERGMSSRSDAIISKQARDADPLVCDGEQFTDPGNLENWVTLND